MPERRCINPKCRRLIYDTEKTEELPDRLECQHCHRINVIRTKPLARKPIEPATSTKEPSPEPEDLSLAASPTFRLASTGDSPEMEPSEEELIPGPVIDESGKEEE